MAKKPSAASRTIDLFGHQIPPVFGHRGIAAFVPSADSNEFPLFAKNRAELSPSATVADTPATISTDAPRKTRKKSTSKPRRPKLKTAPLGRSAAKRLAAKYEQTREELRRCQAKEAHKANDAQAEGTCKPCASKKKTTTRPKRVKSGAPIETRKALVQRATSLHERLNACEARCPAVNRTSIADVDRDNAVTMTHPEADYDDPRPLVDEDFGTQPIDPPSFDEAASDMAPEMHDGHWTVIDIDGHVWGWFEDHWTRETEDDNKHVEELAEDRANDPQQARAHQIAKRSWKEKKQAKAAAFRTRANTLRREAATIEQRNRRLAGVMAGTPIVVGHHSEKRHRRDLEKMRERTHKTLSLENKAETLERRADATESNRAISSDDPDAVEKLRERLARLEAEFPALKGFRRTNARQELTRLRKRIETLEKQAKHAGKEVDIDGTSVVWNASDNRVQIFFAAKPDETVRKSLKSHGFKWAPSQNAWQRMASETAWYFATNIVKDMKKAEL